MRMINIKINREVVNGGIALECYVEGVLCQYPFRVLAEALEKRFKGLSVWGSSFSDLETDGQCTIGFGRIEREVEVHAVDIYLSTLEDIIKEIKYRFLLVEGMIAATNGKEEVEFEV